MSEISSSKNFSPIDNLSRVNDFTTVSDVRAWNGDINFTTVADNQWRESINLETTDVTQEQFDDAIAKLDPAAVKQAMQEGEITNDSSNLLFESALKNLGVSPDSLSTADQEALQTYMGERLQEGTGLETKDNIGWNEGKGGLINTGDRTGVIDLESSNGHLISSNGQPIDGQPINKPLINDGTGLKQ
jgi:hypothetical protein